MNLEARCSICIVRIRVNDTFEMTMMINGMDAIYKTEIGEFIESAGVIYWSYTRVIEKSCIVVGNRYRHINDVNMI